MFNLFKSKKEKLFIKYERLLKESYELSKINREKILKLGRNYLAKNNVLVLEFNKLGIVISKDFFNKDNMENVKFAKTITENNLKKENFIYSFLSSIRTKMEGKKK